jgi:hypothetical protein
VTGFSGQADWAAAGHGTASDAASIEAQLRTLVFIFMSVVSLIR